MGTEALDLIVVGAGPGGYVTALRASQLGLRTALVDRRAQPGGTCLNVGCIPSKALLQSSETLEATQHDLADHGVEVSGVTLHLETMLARKDRVVSEITRGVGGLLKRAKVRLLHGDGRLEDAHTVRVTAPEGSSELLRAENIVLACGSEPTPLPQLPFDGERVVSSTEALSFPEVPSRLVIVGAGVVGLELGSVWRRLGSEVTVVEMQNQLFGGIDPLICRTSERIFRRQGLKLLLGHTIEAVERQHDSLQLRLATKQGNTTLHADRLLVAIGRRPATKNLALDALGLALDGHGAIEVDAQFRTSVPSVRAIGDAIRGPMLAHKASEEGMLVAELLAGQGKTANGAAGNATGNGTTSHGAAVNYRAIPWIVYTHPEIAWVGEGETSLKERGVAYRTGVCNLLANPRARVMSRQPQGLVKVIADAKTDALLGVFIIAPQASEMIGEVVTAFEFEATATDLALTMHGHPTLNEAIQEAALACIGRAIHI